MFGWSWHSFLLQVGRRPFHSGRPNGSFHGSIPIPWGRQCNNLSKQCVDIATENFRQNLGRRRGRICKKNIGLIPMQDIESGRRYLSIEFTGDPFEIDGAKFLSVGFLQGRRYERLHHGVKDGNIRCCRSTLHGGDDQGQPKLDVHPCHVCQDFGMLLLRHYPKGIGFRFCDFGFCVCYQGGVARLGFMVGSRGRVSTTTLRRVSRSWQKSGLMAGSEQQLYSLLLLLPSLAHDTAL